MLHSCENPWRISGPRPDLGGGCRRRGPIRGVSRLRVFLFTAALLFLAPRSGAAEDRVWIQGLADAEVWNTDFEPGPLTRAEGDTAALGRLRLWAEGSFTDRLQGFLLGRLEGGRASETGETETKLEQAYLRYSFAEPRRLILQAGRLTLPYGNVARRYLSSDNPLVGAPLSYYLSYPLGVQLNGAVARFDYMVAVLDGPLTRQTYLAEPRSSARPALAAGVTPITGFRLGAYFTRGNYLSPKADAWLLPGKKLEDYDEKVLGGDLEYGLGHFELQGEVTQRRLDVPAAGIARGRAWYLEPKYTFSPRWYAAMRWEQGNLPDALWIWGTQWAATKERIHDLETGIGFRIAPRFLVKASHRVEIGRDQPGGGANSRAFALAFSYRFDLNAWFHPPR
jgi:hypothetical protein